MMWSSVTWKALFLLKFRMNIWSLVFLVDFVNQILTD